MVFRHQVSPEMQGAGGNGLEVTGIGSVCCLDTSQSWGRSTSLESKAASVSPAVAWDLPANVFVPGLRVPFGSPRYIGNLDLA